MKVKYDKKLKKYHLQFNSKAEKKEKEQIYKNLNKEYPLSMTFDTQIDGKSEEIREQNINSLTNNLNQLDISYQINHREVENMKKIFGIPTMNKKRTTHYIIDFTVPQNTLNKELIDFILEHEIKVAYEDCEIYDSTIFTKMLSSKDLSEYLK